MLPGVRSVQLFNTHSEPLEGSSLLVQIEFKWGKLDKGDAYHAYVGRFHSGFRTQLEVF